MAWQTDGQGPDKHPTGRFSLIVKGKDGTAPGSAHDSGNPLHPLWNLCFGLPDRSRCRRECGDHRAGTMYPLPCLCEKLSDRGPSDGGRKDQKSSRLVKHQLCPTERAGNVSVTGYSKKSVRLDRPQYRSMEPFAPIGVSIESKGKFSHEVLLSGDASVSD